jgi:uncharacterized sporulation protein YeaH/YhbH (DUF444 family)
MSVEYFLEQEPDEQLSPEELAELHASLDEADAQLATGRVNSQEDVDKVLKEFFENYKAKQNAGN